MKASLSEENPASRQAPLPDQPALSRRAFLKSAAVAGGALAAGPLAAVGGAGAASAETAPAEAAPAREDARLPPNGVILFQGDSITDGGRNRQRKSPNNHVALGFNYVPMVVAGLLGAHPRLKLQCYNRGAAGDKVPDLAARWERDCLSFKPCLVSILVGVNDMLHKMAGTYDGTVKDYEEGYAALLERTRQALPEATLVVCEPFALRCGAVTDDWFPEFDERRAAAHRVAGKTGAIWVPLQSAFDDLLSDDTPAPYWSPDGVHPMMPAMAVIARQWLAATGLG